MFGETLLALEGGFGVGGGFGGEGERGEGGGEGGGEGFAGGSNGGLGVLACWGGGWVCWKRGGGTIVVDVSCDCVLGIESERWQAGGEGFGLVLAALGLPLGG